MTKFIHRQGHIRTVYDGDGHLLQFEEWGEKRKRTSIQTWPDEESAKKALFDGSANWEDWIDYPNGTT
jgi:hypothetical protein